MAKKKPSRKKTRTDKKSDLISSFIYEAHIFSDLVTILSYFERTGKKIPEDLFLRLSHSSREMEKLIDEGEALINK